jgi:hypothetical protein
MTPNHNRSWQSVVRLLEDVADCACHTFGHPNDCMSPPLHIAVLVRHSSVMRPVAELVRWIQAQANMRCSVIVVPPAPLHAQAGSSTAFTPATTWSPLRDGLWRLMLMIERARVRRSAFGWQLDAPAALSTLLPAGAMHHFAWQPGESCRSLGLRVRADLRDQLPDLVLHCGGNLPSCDFAVCGTQGLLEFVLGSSHAMADGTFGFWEVLNKSDKTAFAVRHIQSATHKARTMTRGFLPTQTAFLMNQASLLAQLQDSIKPVLNGFANASGSAPVSCDAVVEPIHRDKPTAKQLITYGLSVAKRAITLRMRTLVGVDERWQIHYKRQDWSELNLNSAHVVPNPPGGYFADPFLRATPQGLFCFVEEFLDSSQRGVISVLRLDAKGPVYLGRVLDEPFHLSFPYMFEFGGELYMCPETHQAKQIRLYKCKSFPLQWELHSLVMDHMAAVDSMIFPANGRWWMMAGVLPMGDVNRYPEMHLFSAPDPVSGQWQAHAHNPLKIDPEFARNGGLLRQGEKLFRVAQARAFSAYGASVNISEITQLTTERFEEELTVRLNANSKPGVSGLHHIDTAGGVTVWDEKHWQSVNRLWRTVPHQFQSGPRVPSPQLKVNDS